MMRSEAATNAVTARGPRLRMRRTGVLVATTALAALHGAVPLGVTQTGSTIEVSSTCSLFEAIHSANFDNNIAFAGHAPDAFRTTGCTPGSGDDTIVLPAGAVLRFTTIYNDAYSPFGRAALPIVFSKITIEGNGARLEAAPRVGETFRAFNVGEASIEGPDGDRRGVPLYQLLGSRWRRRRYGRERRTSRRNGLWWRLGRGRRGRRREW